MSASDGFTYVGERFTKNFPDFIEKYRFFDMLQASLHPYGSWQEYWAFESRFIKLNYLDQPVGQSYLALKALMKDKKQNILSLYMKYMSHIIISNLKSIICICSYDVIFFIFH
jgi:NAD-dependent SIR2 family protein deacetylase